MSAVESLDCDGKGEEAVRSTDSSPPKKKYAPCGECLSSREKTYKRYRPHVYDGASTKKEELDVNTQAVCERCEFAGCVVSSLFCALRHNDYLDDIGIDAERELEALVQLAFRESLYPWDMAVYRVVKGLYDQFVLSVTLKLESSIKQVSARLRSGKYGELNPGTALGDTVIPDDLPLSKLRYNINPFTRQDWAMFRLGDSLEREPGQSFREVDTVWNKTGNGDRMGETIRSLQSERRFPLRVPDLKLPLLSKSGDLIYGKDIDHYNVQRYRDCLIPYTGTTEFQVDYVNIADVDDRLIRCVYDWKPGPNLEVCMAPFSRVGEVALAGTKIGLPIRARVAREPTTSDESDIDDDRRNRRQRIRETEVPAVTTVSSSTPVTPSTPAASGASAVAVPRLP